MPKASLNPDVAKSGGGGIEPGVYAITAAKSANLKIQDRPTTLYIVLTADPCDKDGDPTGADAVEIDLSCGRKALEHFHPGTAKDRDDMDPADEGDEVDAEGNTLWSDGEDQLHKSTAIMVFNESLKKVGFPITTLDAGYLPDFVGLKFDITVATAADVNKLLGTRLNTKPMTGADGQDRDVTYKIVKRWLNPTALGAGEKKTAAKGKATNAAAAKPAASAAVNTEKTGNATAEDTANLLLATIAGEKSGKTIANNQAMVGLVTQKAALQKINSGLLKEVQTLIKNEEWLAEALGNMGVTVTEKGYEFA